MSNQKRFINLCVGPAFYLVIWLLGAHTTVLDETAAKGLGVAVWMIYWWVTRPVNITVTALLPGVVNALFNIVPMENVISQYASSSIVFKDIVFNYIISFGYHVYY